MSSGVCKLTGQVGKYVRAHIVPEALYAPLGGIKAFASDASFPPKRSPIGLYDQQLVIEQTERELLAPLDDYGIRFLRQEQGNWFPLVDNGKCSGWLVNKIEYSTIKLFFLSVLWRASASSLVVPPIAYEGLESSLRARLLAGDAGAPNEFGVSLIRYEMPQPCPVMMPRLAEVDNTLGAFALFGGFEAIYYFECPGPSVEPLRLLSDRQFIVLNRDWLSSRPHKMLQELASANKLI